MHWDVHKLYPSLHKHSGCLRKSSLPNGCCWEKMNRLLSGEINLPPSTCALYPIISIFWSLPLFLHSNNCMWDQCRAWPTWLSTAVTCTERRALTAVWPETRTVRGMANPAPDTPTHRRGNYQSTNKYIQYIITFNINVWQMIFFFFREIYNDTFLFIFISVSGGAVGRMWSMATRSDSAEATTPTVSVNNFALPSSSTHPNQKKKYISYFLCTVLCVFI